MELRSIDSLYDSPLNIYTDITPEAEEDLENELKKGQHNTVLVMPDGEIIDGKHRVKKMREMGVFPQVKCTILNYEFKDGEGFYPILDGESMPDEYRQYYTTPESLKMAFSVSRNGDFVFYKTTVVSDAMRKYAIDWDRTRLRLKETPRLPNALKQYAMNADTTTDTSKKGGTEREEKPTTRSEKFVTCPSCGKEINL